MFAILYYIKWEVIRHIIKKETIDVTFISVSNTVLDYVRRNSPHSSQQQNKQMMVVLSHFTKLFYIISKQPINHTIPFVSYLNSQLY